MSSAWPSCHPERSEGPGREGPRAAPAPRSLATLGMTRSELLQNPQIVLEQRPDVRHVVLDHGHAIESQAEGEAAPLLGVDADVAQHLRVNHPAAEDLHPAGLRAGAA